MDVIVLTKISGSMKHKRTFPIKAMLCACVCTNFGWQTARESSYAWQVSCCFQVWGCSL